MSGLVGRHIAFLESLRSAGLPVSLAEDLDAIAALQALDWAERGTVRAGYAATLVKKQSQRPTFDALFDLYFPALVGSGAAASGAGDGEGEDEPRSRRGPRQRPGARRLPGRAAPRAGRRRRPGAAAARRRGGRPVRRHARPRSRAVVVVRLHRAPAGLPVRPRRPGRRGAARPGPGGRRGPAHRRAPARRVHPARRGRRPPADRRGEGARPRRRRRDPAQHRPARLHLRPQGRPRGDAAGDLPARPPARHAADQGAPREAARTARLPSYRPGRACPPAACR